MINVSIWFLILAYAVISIILIPFCTYLGVITGAYDTSYSADNDSRYSTFTFFAAILWPITIICVVIYYFFSLIICPPVRYLYFLGYKYGKKVEKKRENLKD